MKFKKIYVVYVVIILSIAILLPVLLTLDSSDEPILILSDEDFLKYNFPGIGTVDDPYLLENLEMTDQGKYRTTAIYIRNTTKHFIIQNCIISNFARGIYILNVADNTAQILNNHIDTDDIISGSLSVYDCDSILISNNTIVDSYTAIYMIECDYSEISQNTLYHNRLGIDIYTSYGVDVLLNNCSYNINGITLHSSNSINILNNIFNSNFVWWDLEPDPTSLGNGITIYSGSNLQILNNSFSENSRYGIYAANLQWSTISFNNISYNRLAIDHGYGISLDQSHNNSITYNLIEENRKYGIYFYQSRANIVHHNAFIQNGDSVTKNAYSYSYCNNTWFDVYSLEGNYWQGWNTSLPFLVQEESNVDPYPLYTNPVNLELYVLKF